MQMQNYVILPGWFFALISGAAIFVFFTGFGVAFLTRNKESTTSDRWQFLLMGIFFGFLIVAVGAIFAQNLVPYFTCWIR